MQPSPPAPSPSFQDIADTFDALDDWMDRYQYLIDLGRRQPELPEAERSEENRVLGCTSRVWLVVRQRAPVLVFEADSDAAIVKGLVQVVLALVNGRPAADLSALDAEAAFARLGLDEHLTPNRANGLRAMVERVKATARALT